jgi:hypothetical protein
VYLEVRSPDGVRRGGWRRLAAARALPALGLRAAVDARGRVHLEAASPADPVSAMVLEERIGAGPWRYFGARPGTSAVRGPYAPGGAVAYRAWGARQVGDTLLLSAAPAMVTVTVP